MSSTIRNNKEEKSITPKKNISVFDIISQLNYPTLRMYIENIGKAFIVMVCLTIILMPINSIASTIVDYLEGR